MAIGLYLPGFRDIGRSLGAGPGTCKHLSPSSSAEPLSDNLLKRIRNMNSNLPAAALGHFVMKVNDVNISYQFYTKFGLRPMGIFPDGVGIIELRGGTHIVLFNKNDEFPFSIIPSHLGQRGDFSSERLDLMIDSKSRSDLELYRTTLVKNGLSVGEIAPDQFFGHYYFQLADPDGNGITVYTSHVGELPV
ncbi:Glyoxalase/Bleomycin resistance protein/Dioxygenase superfamily protein [Afipia sp. GAS231]|nr:Glyoxalase/Bleomycin resistance protein/Dioxygenase superfamily protein [Afipia sp. GAS231]